jgi:DNA-cytosine methyltransferase
MACGRIALEKLGIKVDKYFSSEIDKYAMEIAKKNYPDIIHVGDVQDVSYPETFDGHKIDLIIGGSPCQGFSFAGQRLNFDDPRSKLFFEFARLVKECKPKYFLLENVSMKQESQDVITEILGVEPVAINSNLVSAQNRQRLYWTNIPFDEQPDDKGILLKDILEDYHQIGAEHFHSAKAVAYMERGNDKWAQAGSRRADGYTQTPDKEKAFTLTANIYKGVPYNYFEDTRATLRPKLSRPSSHFRKLTPIECERLQTVPDNYTEGVSNTQRYKMLGNGWTVDVIAHIFKGLSAD